MPTPIDDYEASQKHGIVPVGGPTAGPLHDRAAGAIIGTAIGYTGVHFGAPGAGEVQSAAIYSASAAAGAYVATFIPPQYRVLVQIAGALALSILGIGVSGCSGKVTFQSCQMYEQSIALQRGALTEACNAATDKLSDTNCIALTAVNVAVTACYLKAADDFPPPPAAQ